MNALLAQIVTPSEGLDSALYQPLYLVMILYVVLFVLGRVFEGRDDPRADTVLDAGFALLCLAAVYVAVLAIYAVAAEFDLIVDMVEIMAIMIGFFALLVVALLGIELLIGLAGRGRRKRAAVPPPQQTRTSAPSRRAARRPGRLAGTRTPTCSRPLGTAREPVVTMMAISP